jgi:pyrimidine operon attenuation protein / uracil phosphoribosyltransferase
MANTVILNRDQISRLLEHLAEAIIADVPPDSRLALVGIRSRGEILAQRLQKLIESKFQNPVELGALDITLYRDDLNTMGYDQPIIQSTEIDFGIDDRLVVLVDDVLSTGRSVRAALDALADLGRPRAIRLAVLVDRGRRELPIRADYVGTAIEVPIEQKVQVYLEEADDREEVVLE